VITRFGIVKIAICFSGSRFPGSLNMDMNEIATNLVPYPKLHYIFSSISPVTLSAPNMCKYMQEAKYINFLFLSCSFKFYLKLKNSKIINLIFKIAGRSVHECMVAK